MRYAMSIDIFKVHKSESDISLKIRVKVDIFLLTLLLKDHSA